MYLMQEPSPPERAKDEYDVIEMSHVKCLPAGFTKWDSTEVHQGDLSLREFLRAVKRQTGLQCDLLFHHVAELDDPKFKPVSGRMLYDRHAFSTDLKATYAKELDTRLVDWVTTRYAGLVEMNGRYIELQTSCSDDQEAPYRIPTVIYKYK